MLTLARYITAFSVVILSMTLVLGCGLNSLQQEESDGARRNELLLSAASPFEDLIEFAEVDNEEGIAKSISEAKLGVSDVRDALDASELHRLDALVNTIDDARKTSDGSAIALNAVESYHVLISALDESTVVPKAVSLLDYSGFKLHILSGTSEPDWTLMGEVVREAAGLWETIEGDVGERGLRDTVNTTMRGMQDALTAHDARMARFAASIELDLVDLLENYFEARSHA